MTRRRLCRAVSILAAALGLVGCAPDLATLQKRLEPHYRIQRPQSSGPSPAVLLVPGCEGIVPARVQMAGELVRRGYIVVFVDYLAARGLQTACAGEVTPAEVARDIGAVSAYLRTLPAVRSRAVAAIGWSLGGSGVLATLPGAEWERQPALDAAVAFYPVCRGLQRWRATIPTLVLLAGLDDIAPPASCEDLVGRSPGRNQVLTFPDARHSFDMPDLPASAPSRAFPGRTVGFHAEAARQAWGEVLAHLQTRLP
jgi:dienelactone hydrolase